MDTRLGSLTHQLPGYNKHNPNKSVIESQTQPNVFAGVEPHWEIR
jgi:hypothetical protein